MSLQTEIPKIVEWLQDRVTEARCAGLVVGLSGGVDSAVCAALMKQAFPQNSLGISIPISSEPADAADAILLAQAVDITYSQIDLTAEHQTMLEKTKQVLAGLGIESEQRMMDANLRARLRMSTVYAAANALNYLVIGTDNAAEWYTGYFTKHGDGACDLLPLRAFTKGEVRELANILALPQQIINKPPSAGLWQGQTDEQELGTSYQAIDAFLRGEDIPDGDRQIIEALHQQTSHKRTSAPYYPR